MAASCNGVSPALFFSSNEPLYLTRTSKPSLRPFDAARCPALWKMKSNLQGCSSGIVTMLIEPVAHWMLFLISQKPFKFRQFYQLLYSRRLLKTRFLPIYMKDIGFYNGYLWLSFLQRVFFVCFVHFLSANGIQTHSS